MGVSCLGLVAQGEFFRGHCPGGNFPGGNCIGGNCPRGSCSGVNFSRIIVWVAKFRGVIVLGII